MPTPIRIAAIVTAVALLALGPVPASPGTVEGAPAQTSRLVVIPDQVDVGLGSSAVLEVRVENVASLWGGQIALRYDPSVVQVVDDAGAPADAIEGGDFLDPVQVSEIINTVDREAGRIEYAVALRHNPRRPVEAASGSGTLARIRLKGVAGGTTTLAFSTDGATYVREIKFVDGDLNEFTLPTQDGAVTVGEGGGKIYLPLAMRLHTLGRALADRPPVPAPWVPSGRRSEPDASRLMDIPDFIAATGSSVRHVTVDVVTVDGNYAYWSEGAAELGCDTAAGEARIARVSLDTGDVEELLANCESDPGDLVVWGAAVYYIDGHDDLIVWMNAEAGPGGHRWGGLVGAGNGLDSRSRLVQDDTHLYFNDADGIKGVAKSGGTPELLAEASLVTALAVDEADVYWLQIGSQDRIRRVSKTGGPPTTVYEQPDRVGLSGLAVDATHVYWTQAGGMARRIAKAGGSPEDYGVAGSWLGGGVTLDAENVYWNDEGRIRRAPKNHRDAPDDLALGMVGVKDMQVAGDRLVWKGGRAAGEGIWALPLEASEVTVDLQITGFEVTQAVQNMDNDIPLIRGKATLVRLYPVTNGPYIHDVPAQLRGFRGGSELPGSPLAPIEPTLSVRNSGAYRERLDQTFNFLLPESWTEGTVELRGEINPGAAVPEANVGNNALTETVTFTRRDAMCVKMLPVRTSPVTAATHDPGFSDIADWARGAHGVPGLRIRRGTMIEEVEWCRWHGLPYLCGGPFEMPDDSGWVLAAIWAYNLFDGNDRGCDTTFYAGMVHQDGIVRDGTIGSSYVDGRELWATMDTDPAVLGGRWSWFRPFGGAILAHELGHSLGRRHVDCGGPDADSIDRSYPYDPCDMGPDDVGGYYGTDVLDMAVVAPTEAGDLMSYAHNEGKPEWVSDWTYRAFVDALSLASHAGGPAPLARPPGTDTGGPAPGATFNNSGALVSAVMQAAENIAVTGVVSPTAGAGSLGWVTRLPSGLVDTAKLSELTARVAVGPAGRYSVALQRAGGGVLGAVRFDVPEESDAPGEARGFQVILPYDPATERIVLSEGATERAAREASAAAPTVEVLSPNGGESIAGPLTVKWRGADADGDTLHYTVQYSPDAGVSWQPLAVEIFTTTLTMADMSPVPGSDRALVRVVAGDGVHTATDTSDGTFAVDARAPEVQILRPGDGAVVAPNRMIIASGTAYDSEDGTIDGNGLAWSVDGTAAGRGGYVAIGPLAVGRHTVTLRAADGSKQEGQDTVTVNVQRDQCAAANTVDLVFVLDTSPAMSRWLGGACSTIKDTLAAFSQGGFDTRSRVLGVTQPAECADSSVRAVIPNSAADHPADWGVAVGELSLQYPWRPGATRIIVPVSNQGPEDGDPVEDPGADRDTVNAAIGAALRGRVAIAPMLVLAGLGPQPEPPELPLAYELAKATGGQVLAWHDAKEPVAAQILRLVPAASCVPSAMGVSPSCGLDADTTLTLHGRNLTTDTVVLVGSSPARDATVNADGTRVTFKVPADLVPGRTYDVRVERRDLGGDTLPGAVTYGPCSDRCDDYAPGDVVLPMWRIRTPNGDVEFEALAASSRMTVRLYAHDGPVKLLVQEADGTGIASVGVPTATTGRLSVTTVPGGVYRLVAQNAHAPATRFRLYAGGAQWVRTADDGDDFGLTVNPGRGEDHGAPSSPELGFKGRWTELDPAFGHTTWFFNVSPGDSELAVRVWSESVFGLGHDGMSWIRPNGTVQPLIGAEANGFDRTFRVNDPEPGYWGLRLNMRESAAADSAGAGDLAAHSRRLPDGQGPDQDDPPEILYFSDGNDPQGYSLARVDQGADDWLYITPNSMLGPPCGPTVLVLPVPAASCQGDVLRSDIVVADVANLYGAEVHLSFPPDLVEAVDDNNAPTQQLTPGDFLDPSQGLVGANFVDNALGLIDYAVSLRDPAAAAFGSGVLASVYFRTEAVGNVDIGFDEVKLSERPIPPAPAARPEAAARGASFTITDCYSGGQTTPGTIRGSVVLDGRTGFGGARVTVTGAGRVLTPNSGDYVVRSVSPGTHQIDVALAGYLRAGARDIDLRVGEVADVPAATLLGGDCNASDGIDIVDASIVGRYYATTGGWAADQHPDINDDGVVDIYDLVMIGNNFGCRTEDTDPRCLRWDRR
ncbi:MAG: hypothetical protein ACE5EL_00010 [Anaerolineae bacterium]